MSPCTFDPAQRPAGTVVDDPDPVTGARYIRPRCVTHTPDACPFNGTHLPIAGIPGCASTSDTACAYGGTHPIINLR